MIKATGPFERVVHWCVALSCLFLCLTGMAMMYHSLNGISALVGGMENLKNLHNYCGIFFGVSLFFTILMWWREAGLFSFPEDLQWILAADGKPIWDQPFMQVWQQCFSSDGRRLGAIVSPRYGRWTVALDGQPWSATFNEMVTDMVFSPDGRRAAALGKSDGKWQVVVDGQVWPGPVDMAWKPVFSPDGAHVAAKVEKGGKYGYLFDGRPWSLSCEAAWDPLFSPDGTKVLVRIVEGGNYIRRVIPLAALQS